jgi:hypothetical protein
MMFVIFLFFTVQTGAHEIRGISDMVLSKTTSVRFEITVAKAGAGTEAGHSSRCQFPSATCRKSPWDDTHAAAKLIA